jgi:predicted RNA-binding Zn-ribbon protein involved in translation (DUF1610 family)
MTIAGGKCACGEQNLGETCPVCGIKKLYWCDSCRQPVAEKRCPLCGLKARKMREGIKDLR